MFLLILVEAMVDDIACHLFNKESGIVGFSAVKAFGFAEGKSIMLKIQAQKNTERSQTGVLEGHFATVEEVLDWLKSDVGI